jgi:hypothetical protein
VWYEQELARPFWLLPLDKSRGCGEDAVMARVKCRILVILIASAAAAAYTTAAPASTAYTPTSLATRAAAAQPVRVDALACRRGYYKNVSGHCVRRPGRDPRGATARCSDGTYSYSEHASGTCSHHGGVSRWIHHP